MTKARIHRLSMKWQTAPLLLLATFMTFMPPHVSAVESTSTMNLDHQVDWLLIADTRTESNFLNYSGGNLSSLTIVSVSERLTTRSLEPGDTMGTTATKYEDFWYHDNTIIGQKRFQNLKFEDGTTGAIFVRVNSNDTHRTRPIANAIIRLVLEQYLAQNSIASVYVPDQAYNQIIGEIGRYNFFPEMKMEVGQQLNIKLVGYPSGSSNYFYYQKSSAN